MEWSTWPYSQRNPFFWVPSSPSGGNIISKLLGMFFVSHHRTIPCRVANCKQPHWRLRRRSFQEIPHCESMLISSNIFTGNNSLATWSSGTLPSVSKFGIHLVITSQCCAGTMERYESRPPSCSAESLSSSSIDLEDHYRGGYSTSKAWPWKDKNIHWLVDDFPTNTSIYQKKIRF